MVQERVIIVTVQRNAQNATVLGKSYEEIWTDTVDKQAGLNAPFGHLYWCACCQRRHKDVQGGGEIIIEGTWRAASLQPFHKLAEPQNPFGVFFAEKEVAEIVFLDVQIDIQKCL